MHKPIAMHVFLHMKQFIVTISSANYNGSQSALHPTTTIGLWHHQC